MVEANRGYHEEPTKLRIPVDYMDATQKDVKCGALPCQETVNACFKQFGPLSSTFSHHVTMDNMLKHKVFFCAIAIITQLGTNNGKKLFPVAFH